jgi:hypothetical protein
MSSLNHGLPNVEDEHSSIRLDARPPEAAREHRMLMALLWAIDPCRYVAKGGSVSEYGDLAARAVMQLNARPVPRAGDLVSLFNGQADPGSAAQFATAALDWWARRAAFR